MSMVINLASSVESTLLSNIFIVVNLDVGVYFLSG